MKTLMGAILAAALAAPEMAGPRPPFTSRTLSNFQAPAPCRAPLGATASSWRSRRSTPKILGRKIETPHLDTQSDAGISRAQIQKVLDNDPYVVLGPVFSGSVLVDMVLTQQAEVAEIVAGEAAAITQRNNPYVFRTSFGQQYSMPKIANYVRDGLKAKTVAVLWVNDDFGEGNRDSFLAEAKARGIKAVADIPTESGHVDFSADVIKLKAANADVIFVYTNEEESARFLREAQKQGIKAP